jgi:hypothetical protein
VELHEHRRQPPQSSGPDAPALWREGGARVRFGLGNKRNLPPKEREVEMDSITIVRIVAVVLFVIVLVVLIQRRRKRVK